VILGVFLSEFGVFWGCFGVFLSDFGGCLSEIGVFLSDNISKMRVLLEISQEKSSIKIKSHIKIIKMKKKKKKQPRTWYGYSHVTISTTTIPNAQMST
jgi:hypothetical protein